MTLQKIKFIAITEIIIGLLALVLLFSYGPSLRKESCGFAGAIEGFLFLTALLLFAGIPTLLLHPLGRWIHIIFSPIIAFIFSGIIFYLLISTPIVKISYQLACAPVVLFVIMLPIFIIMILFFFLDLEGKKLFKVIKE